jgi:hypothetical protein
MRVSIVNFCSTAADMLEFSTDQLFQCAGTDEFDYLVVTWNPTDVVRQFLRTRPEIRQVPYETDHNFAYVPNLRRMFNLGFGVGYQLNDYVCIVNTDMAFGRDWLVNLTRRATPEIIPNSLHITPIKGPNVVTADCGLPTWTSFNFDRFWKLHDQLYCDKVETEEERGGWRATQTLPYVIHRKWWERCGPWLPTHVPGQEPPDRQFFSRVHEAGGRYILCHDSICYHHEAGERRSGKRPEGAEHMREEQ